MALSLNSLGFRILKSRHTTIVLLVLTLLVLLLALPATLRDDYNRGGFYLFSQDFINDIPKRLTGPGRFRFILQPLMAIFLGILGGLADARAGRPPYIYGILFHRGVRRALMRSAFESVANVLLMGILLDAVFQWIILGVSYPGAALVVGPALILMPYTIARAFSNRLAR